MTPFPVDLLLPAPGLVGPHPLRAWFVRIPLRPFSWNGEATTTALRWDFAELGRARFADLAGERCTFAPRTLDASLYLGGAHHPVDILMIAFGTTGDRGTLSAQITAQVDFGFEGLDGHGVTDWVFDCNLRWTDAAQPA